jgi:magnesium transporter
LISVFVHEDGAVIRGQGVEPQWLAPASTKTLWVDLAAPTEVETRLLSDVFRFHPLSVDDARSTLQFPKIEPYPGYLYLVLHGIDVKKGRTQFATRDVDFFVGRNYLVTVHDGQSRSIETLRHMCDRRGRLLDEGPIALLHRIVDSMVDNYRPVIEGIEDRIAGLEDQAYSGRERLGRQLLKLKHELSTIFMPLTVLTGMWGMDIPLPRFPGPDAAQFWRVCGMMAAISVAMLVLFRRKRWI